MPHQTSQTTHSCVPGVSPKREDRADSAVPGLALRVQLSGHAAWRVRKRSPSGAIVAVTICTDGAMPLAEVRAIARDLLVRIARGERPDQDLREARQREEQRRTAVRRAAVTVGVAWVAFDSMQDGVYQPKSVSLHQSLWRRHLAQVESKRIGAITTADAIALHQQVGRDAGHPTANRMRALGCALWAYAIRQLGADCGNPWREVPKHREAPRTRVLTADEARRLWLATAVVEPRMGVLLRVLILSGARRGSVQSMRWEDVDLERAVWAIPRERFKGGRAVVLPLSIVLVDVLRRWKQIAPVSDWVFPSRWRDSFVGDVRDVWAKACLHADIRAAHPHDVRRTFASTLAAAGVPLLSISRLLGHTSTRTTEAVYARIGVESLREHALRAADLFPVALPELISIDDDDLVMPLT